MDPLHLILSEPLPEGFYAAFVAAKEKRDEFTEVSIGLLIEEASILLRVMGEKCSKYGLVAEKGVVYALVGEAIITAMSGLCLVKSGVRGGALSVLARTIFEAGALAKYLAADGSEERVASYLDNVLRMSEKHGEKFPSKAYGESLRKSRSERDAVIRNFYHIRDRACVSRFPNIAQVFGECGVSHVYDSYYRLLCMSVHGFTDETLDYLFTSVAGLAARQKTIGEENIAILRMSHLEYRGMISTRCFWAGITFLFSVWSEMDDSGDTTTKECLDAFRTLEAFVSDGMRSLLYEMWSNQQDQLQDTHTKA